MQQLFPLVGASVVHDGGLICGCHLEYNKITNEQVQLLYLMSCRVDVSMSESLA